MGKDVIYTIKEAARKLHLHEQTLRNWERAGIIKLQRFGKNRSRLFRPTDIDRCRWIQRYSGRGISLRGVKVLLEMNRQLNGGGRS
jgi:DNA-binding transcriptional MerR regulator